MLGRILIVDDDPDMRDLLEADLTSRDFEPHVAGTAEQALERLQQADFEAVLTDLRMPGMDGIQLTKRFTAARPDIPVVVITGFGSMETAVAAIRAGAFDFVTKPVEMDLLAAAMWRAVEHHRLENQVQILRQRVERSGRFGRLLGESAAMQKLFAQLEQLAETDAAVLVTGETGTGKELVANALHAQSPRCGGPFVALNCAAVPQNLLESELFGHTRGAFTGAQSARKGLLLQASGGSLFLDEIGELPLSLQPKLLRALDTGVIRAVGSDHEQRFDARLISATNRDLTGMVEQGTFREDLFFRLNVIQLGIPPLRSRGRDVLLIAQHVLNELTASRGNNITGFAPAVAARFLAYDWPGNVRELRNVIERAVALTRFSQIMLEDLPPNIRDFKSDRLLIDAGDPSQLSTLAELEQRYIRKVLRATYGNKSLAAQILGVDRRTLYRKIEQDPTLIEQPGKPDPAEPL